MLVIKDLSIYLSKDLRVLLDDFNFSLQPGQKVAVIGEEGNGKSTLLKAIAEPESLRGYAEARGEIIADQEIIGYLPQVLTPERLMTDTETFLNKRVNWDHFDYTNSTDLASWVFRPSGSVQGAPARSVRVKDQIQPL